MLPSIIIVVVERETIFLLHILKLVVQVGEFVLFVLIILAIFFQTFQRGFAMILVLFFDFNVVKGFWDGLVLRIIVDTRDIRRMIVRIRKCRRGIDQAEVIRGKSVTHLMCARIEGVALNAGLMQGDGMHPNEKGVAKIVEGIMPKVEELLAKIPPKG